MPARFHQLLQTPAVERAQAETYGRVQVLGDPADSDPELLGAEEIRYIAARDSFYLASVGETGWPYVQHRGGPPGFLAVLDPGRLAFAELPGNRQMFSTGNIAARSRVALFLMNYPGRERLKILGHAQTFLAGDRPDVVGKLVTPAGRPAVRVVVIEVQAYDWNCPQYITPRYTRAEVTELVAPLQRRVAELEAALSAKS